MKKHKTRTPIDADLADRLRQFEVVARAWTQYLHQTPGPTLNQRNHQNKQPSIERIGEQDWSLTKTQISYCLIRASNDIADTRERDRHRTARLLRGGHKQITWTHPKTGERTVYTLPLLD